MEPSLAYCNDFTWDSVAGNPSSYWHRGHPHFSLQFLSLPLVVHLALVQVRKMSLAYLALYCIEQTSRKTLAVLAFGSAYISPVDLHLKVLNAKRYVLVFRTYVGVSDGVVFVSW